MVSGNKGGVGKSAVAIGLTEALKQECGEHEVSVIDGDGRTPDVHRIFDRKVPTRLLDFRHLRPDSHLSMTEDEYFRIVMNHVRVTEHVVINTPDGADDQLMGWFDSTLQCTESMSGDVEVLFKFLFVMSPVEDGLRYLDDLSQRFERLYPIRNLHFGDESKFKVFNERFAPLFELVVDFPRLKAGELDRVKTFRVPPWEYAEMVWDREVPEVVTPRAFSRKRVRDWMCDVTEALGPVINTHGSNLKQGII
jgi:hypothetical protein